MGPILPGRLLRNPGPTPAVKKPVRPRPLPAKPQARGISKIADREDKNI